MLQVDHEITEWRRLHKVPPYIRESKKHLYDPVVLSLRRYHHGQLQFSPMDEFREEAYIYMLESIGGDKVMDMFRQRIQDKIHDIRNFYRGVSEEKYDDVALIKMIVHDTYFVLYRMEMATEHGDKLCEVRHHLGRIRTDIYVARLLSVGQSDSIMCNQSLNQLKI